jgi:hypothetical protein
MKASKFSDEQTAMALWQAKAGHPVGQIWFLSLEEAPRSRCSPREIAVQVTVRLTMRRLRAWRCWLCEGPSR